MTVGLRIPVGVNPGGGVSLVDGDIQNDKIIKLALGSDESENAFQGDVAIGQSMVFDLSDRSLRARIQRRVEAIFKGFQVQNRFKLVRGSLKFESDSVNQELIMDLKYIDLESDTEQSLTRQFGAGE